MICFFEKLYTWITNIGESFLNQHRDFGTDIAYISDYIDNHQQMISDMSDYEDTYKHVKLMSQDINDSQVNGDISRQMHILEQSWLRLERSVENRIFLSTIYLEFVKSVNEFRNCALDINELMNAFNNLSPLTGSQSLGIYEKHIDKKAETFDDLFNSIVKNANRLIAELRNVIIELIIAKPVKVKLSNQTK